MWDIQTFANIRIEQTHNEEKSLLNESEASSESAN